MAATQEKFPRSRCKVARSRRERRPKGSRRLACPKAAGSKLNLPSTVSWIDGKWLAQLLLRSGLRRRRRGQRHSVHPLQQYADDIPLARTQWADVEAEVENLMGPLAREVGMDIIIRFACDLNPAYIGLVCCTHRRQRSGLPEAHDRYTLIYSYFEAPGARCSCSSSLFLCRCHASLRLHQFFQARSRSLRVPPFRISPSTRLPSFQCFSFFSLPSLRSLSTCYPAPVPAHLNCNFEGPTLIPTLIICPGLGVAFFAEEAMQ